MRDPIMEEVFGAIEEGSPLAGAVETLLEDGLAVDDAELDAATDALMSRIEAPRRRWPGATIALLSLAAAAAGWVMVSAPDTVAPPAEGPVVLSPAAPVSSPPGRPAAPAMAQLTVAERCLDALRAGDIDAGLSLFEQLLDSGEFEEDALRELVQALHQLSVKAPPDDPDRAHLFATTGLGYDAWIEAFGDAPEATSMHCAYGELLHKTQRFEAAYTQYSKGMQGRVDATESPGCGASAIDIADNMMRRQAEDGSDPVDPEPGASVWEERLVAAVEQALSRDPEPPNATSLSYKAAYTLYVTGEHERAVDWFQDTIDRDPTSEEAKYASHLIMDSYAKAEDWQGLEEWALAFHADEEVGSAADREQALSIASRAGRAALEQDGSADGWLAWLDRYGDDPEVIERTIAALREEERDAEADALETAGE